jgi:hypothetical protein
VRSKPTGRQPPRHDCRVTVHPTSLCIAAHSKSPWRRLPLAGIPAPDMETLVARLGPFAEGIIGGIISGIMTFFVLRAGARYWARYTLRGMRRRLEYAEAKKAQLDDLAKSDRSILLFAFGAIFVILAMISIAAIATTVFSVLEEGPSFARILSGAIWLFVAAISFSFAILFKQLREYPESARTVEQKISDIKRKLLGNGH